MARFISAPTLSASDTTFARLSEQVQCKSFDTSAFKQRLVSLLEQQIPAGEWDLQVAAPKAVNAATDFVFDVTRGVPRSVRPGRFLISMGAAFHSSDRDYGSGTIELELELSAGQMVWQG